MRKIIIAGVFLFLLYSTIACSYNARDNRESNTLQSEVETEKNDDNQTDDFQDDRITNTKKKKCNSFSVWLFGLLFGIGGGIYCWEKWLREVVFSIFPRNKSNSVVEDSYQDEYEDIKKTKRILLKKCEILELEKNKFREECSEKQKQIDKVSQELRKIQNHFTNIDMEEIADIEEHKNKNISNKESIIQSSVSTLYADSIIDGFFNSVVETPNEDTVYEISKKSDNKAAFRIYANAYKRVLKNTDFIDGCEKQRMNSVPQTLEVENGETTLCEGSGKWKITKKAKIKLV